MNKLSIILGKKRFLPLACLAISAGLLIAGLWPFQFRPVNNVHWIDGQAGLRFGRYGMVSGQSPLFTPGGPLDFAKPFTIRLELLPRDEPSDYLPRILSVYEAGGRELFILGQWKSALNLSILERQRAYYFEYQETEVGNLPKGAKRSILLSSGETGLRFTQETRAHRPVWFFTSAGESGARVAPPRELSLGGKSLAGGSSLALLLC
jgi:hypothetical protein